MKERQRKTEREIENSKVIQLVAPVTRVCAACKRGRERERMCVHVLYFSVPALRT